MASALAPTRMVLLAVAWVALARTARADPPTRAPAPPPAPAPAVAADWVAVTLQSDDPHAALYAREPRKIGAGDEVVDAWSFVCLAPCGDRVDPRKGYRVMGESLVPSIDFDVTPGSGSIALAVHAHHPRSPGVTAGLGITGGVSALGGVLLLLLDLAEHGAASALGEVPKEKRQLNHTASTYGDVGAGLLAGGAVFGGIALVYAVTGGKTELAPAGATTQRTAGSGLRLIPMGFAF